MQPFRGFAGVFEHQGDIYTRNLTPGKTVYGEPTIFDSGVEYRSWTPTRSKLSAAIKCGLKEYFLKPASKVLYLGAANGTTVSHVSDICTAGMIFAVEISARSGRDLVELSKSRNNVYPIIGDARTPGGYISLVDIGVDIIYQDVAQRDQANIFLKNAHMYLKSGGTGYLMLKTKSVDVAASAEEVLKKTQKQLKDGGLNIVETINLSRYEKEHYAIAVRME